MTVTSKMDHSDIDSSSFRSKAIGAKKEVEKVPSPVRIEGATAKKERVKKEKPLRQVSVKLHPDIVDAINDLAKKQRKMPAEVMRDLLLKALLQEPRSTLA